jgi:dihydrofolate reductase
MEADLVDEHRLLVFPVIAGSGRRLFREGGPPRAFKPVMTATSSTGVVAAAYVRNGPLVTGSFQPQ